MFRIQGPKQQSFLLLLLCLGSAFSFSTRTTSTRFSFTKLHLKRKRTTTSSSSSPSGTSSSTSLNYRSSNATDVAVAPPPQINLPFEAGTSTLLLEDLLSVQQPQDLAPRDNPSLVLEESIATAAITTATQQQQEEEEGDQSKEKAASKNDDDAVVKARLLLLGSAALYGTNFSLVKILGETGMSVGLSSTLRFGMAALATLPWLLKLNNNTNDDDDNNNNTNKRKSKRNRLEQLFDPNGIEFQSGMRGLEVGMWNSIGYVAQAVGLETTSASKSAFLCSMAVVIVPILDYLEGKTLLNKQIVGTLLAVIGVGFLELGDAVSAGGGLDTHLQGGDIASLIQPIAFGIGFWRMESAMNKFPNEADRATAAQLLAVFLGSFVYMMTVGLMEGTSGAAGGADDLAAAAAASSTSLPTLDQLMTWVTDPTILFALFWTGVVTTALTIYMETVALKTLSAAETTLIFSTEPLWGTAFAVAVMGETLGLNAAVGAVMILAGCLYSNLGMNGMFSFLPSQCRRLGQEQQCDQENLLQLEAIMIEHGCGATNSRCDGQATGRNIFPTNALGKVSLRSAVAGALTGIVALVESASGSGPTFQPNELQELLESYFNLQLPWIE